MPFLESKFPNTDDNGLSKGLSIDKIESLIKLSWLPLTQKGFSQLIFPAKYL